MDFDFYDPRTHVEGWHSRLKKVGGNILDPCYKEGRGNIEDEVVTMSLDHNSLHREEISERERAKDPVAFSEN